MSKVLSLELEEEKDKWGDVYGEILRGVTDFGTNIQFSAFDLNECPEDAVLGRDLYGAYDFVSALKLGMKLAQEGYTDIVVSPLEEDIKKEIKND